jgi:putative addiction module component (TIGR02574 family)
VTSAAKKILEQALTLPAEEREALVTALSSSLERVELTSQWQGELVRRVDRIERGEAVFHDAEAHLQALRAKYHG